MDLIFQHAGFASSGTLYHYTSLETLRNILSEKAEMNACFWMSHPYFTNDSKEMDLGFDALDRLLDQNDITKGIREILLWLYATLASAWGNSKREEKFQHRIQLLDDADRDKIMEFVKELKGSLEKIKPKLFIASFCEKADFLPMWQNFGDDGRGTCLEIDQKELMEHLKPIDSNSKDPILPYLGNVDYIDHIETLAHKIRSVVEHFDFDDMSEQAMPLLFEFLKHFSLLKHSSFEQEHEIRLVKIFKNPSASNEVYESKNGIITPYHKLELPISSIKGITLGPKCEKERNKLSIRNMLKRFKLNDEKISLLIKESTIPYR